MCAHSTAVWPVRRQGSIVVELGRALTAVAKADTESHHSQPAGTSQTARTRSAPDEAATRRYSRSSRPTRASAGPHTGHTRRHPAGSRG
jgi:hypothetical protein